MSGVQSFLLAAVLVLASGAALRADPPADGQAAPAGESQAASRATPASFLRLLPASVSAHPNGGQQAVVETAPAVAAASAAAVDISHFTAMGGLSNHAPAGYVSPAGHWPTAGTSRSHDFDPNCSGLAVDEGEPVCGDDYVDNFNGGCNSTPPVFQAPITPEVIHGTSGTYSVAGQSGYRDTDWYVYEATESTKITWSALAEFPVLIFLIDGTQGCGGYTILQSAVADPCKTATIEKCVAAGTYWLLVMPSVFEGVDCGAQYCATLSVDNCTVPDPIACPEGSFPGAWQLAYGEDEAWQLFVSNDRFPDYDPNNGIKLFEHFKGIGAPPAIEDLHWWGVTATYDDERNLVECPLDPVHFHIAFWAHNKVTNRPLYEETQYYGGMYAGVPAPLFEFDAAVSGTDTGHVYRILNDDGSVEAEYTLWLYGCDVNPQLTASAGWISIQNSDDCAFWWAASRGPPAGTGGVHVQETDIGGVATREDVDGDLSWCLTTSYTGPFTGACCDTVQGVCRNTTGDDCVGNYEEWHASQTCSQIQCQAEVWACCEGSPAICSRYSLPNCTGDWYRFYVCSTTDPLYDPDFFGPGQSNLETCPPIAPPCTTTCDSPAAFDRGLTGGYLYISWDRGPGDQRYVIDSFSGFDGAINRIKWWGVSCFVWDGPDCDFDQPAPFAVRFYHSNPSGTGPDYNNPSMVYDPVYAEWDFTDLGWWPSCPECGSPDCYIATLPTSYSPGTGTQWISVASKAVDCDFIWAPGLDGSTPGQWFYDNGTCEPEPGQRHRSFCLYTTAWTGACCNEISGVCDDGVPETDCLAEDGEVFYRNIACAAVPGPGCYAHPGACCDHNDGTCSITLGSDCTEPGRVWRGADSTCDQCCVALCPADGIAEGEPLCGPEYVDTYNMGCFTAGGWSAADFVPIGDGQTICGQSGVFTVGGETRRDIDFYTYELTDPCAIIQAKVRAEFRPDVSLMVGQCYTDTWCGQEQTYVLTYSQASAEPCGYAVASAPLFGPATYYIMVSCFGEAGDVPCGAPYTLEIEKQPAALCTMGEEATLRSQAACLALGGTWGDPGECGLGACCLACQCSVTSEGACSGSFMGAGTTCAPANSCCLERGDANCDGAVNAFDIDPFVLALTNRDAWCAAYSCDYYCAIDCNGDGAMNAFDIDPFVACLAGAGRGPE